MYCAFSMCSDVESVLIGGYCVWLSEVRVCLLRRPVFVHWLSSQELHLAVS